MANKIWIDTMSGTWGDFGQEAIAVVDIDAVALATGKTTDEILDELNSGSDSEIINFGVDHGKYVDDPE